MNQEEALMQITSIKLKAENIFNSLKKALFNSVLIVCVKPDNTVQCYGDTDKDTKNFDFSNIFQLAESLRNVSQGKFLFNTNPVIQENYEQYFSQSEFDSAIKMVVNQMDFYHEYEVFVSGNIIRSRENEKGYLVLKLNKSEYDDIYKIPVSSDSRFHLVSNIVDAVVESFFEEVSKAEDHESDGFNVSQINPDLVIANAAISFMCTPTSNLRNGDGMFGLTEKLNAISSMEYEKNQISHGSIILTYKDNPIVSYIIKFKNPVPLNNARHVRKLLEMTTNKMKLISDASLVYGLGDIFQNFNPLHGDVYEIIFNKQYSWTLYHDNKNVLNYYMGKPYLQRNIISQKEFSDKFLRIFGDTDIQKENANNFYNIVFSIIQEQVGTILVISENAKNESERLKGQSLMVEPIKLQPSNVPGLIKIDGALMVDENGICYSLGTILDGLAVKDKGNSARGSRYNSSIRYFYSQYKNCKLIIVIISDDGDVDILPYLPTRMKKSFIVKFIETIKKKYEEAKKGNKIDTGEYNTFYSDARDLSIYFSKEECNFLNEYFSYLENNCKQEDRARIVFRPLSPDSDYSEDLYLENDIV